VAQTELDNFTRSCWSK